MAKIDKIPHLRKKTYTGKAMQFLYERLQENQQDNRAASVILITDGRADDPEDVVKYSKKMKKAGYMIFAIAVGSTAAFEEAGTIAYSEQTMNSVVKTLNSKSLRLEKTILQFF